MPLDGRCHTGGSGVFFAGRPRGAPFPVAAPLPFLRCCLLPPRRRKQLSSEAEPSSASEDATPLTIWRHMFFQQRSPRRAKSCSGRSMSPHDPSACTGEARIDGLPVRRAHEQASRSDGLVVVDMKEVTTTKMAIRACNEPLCLPPTPRGAVRPKYGPHRSSCFFRAGSGPPGRVHRWLQILECRQLIVRWNNPGFPHSLRCKKPHVRPSPVRIRSEAS
jgi:hypothetical protein